MKTNQFKILALIKHFFLAPLFISLFISLGTIEAQEIKRSRSIRNYSEFVFCIITKDTKQKKLDLIQKELGHLGFVIDYKDLAFSEDGKIKSIQLNVKTKEGYAGTATMASDKPILYFYQLYNNSKKPFNIGAGNPDKKIPGDIKDKIIARDGGYEYAFNPKKDQNFSATRVMGNDPFHEKVPDTLINAIVVLDGKIILESEYLKKIRDDYPMDETFIEAKDAIKKYGEKARGGAIILTTKKK